jgi:uncharacterized protein involved in exopolysaccharide biosynthesis
MTAQTVYEFSTLIRFEDPRSSRSVTGIDDSFADMETESKVRMIQTRNFLNEVIDSLNLYIGSSTPGVSRHELFKTIRLNDNFKYGSYEIVKKNNELMFNYTNKSEGFENEVIATTSIQHDSVYSITVNGIYLEGYVAPFEDHEKLTFSCTPARYLLEGLQNNIQFSINRQQTLLTITYKHSDAQLGVDILNTVADLFLEKSYENKQAKTKTVLMSLEEQLQTSKTELETIEEEYRRFRQRNPHVYLTEELASANQSTNPRKLLLFQKRQQFQICQMLFSLLGNLIFFID